MFTTKSMLWLKLLTARVQTGAPIVFLDVENILSSKTLESLGVLMSVDGDVIVIDTDAVQKD